MRNMRVLLVHNFYRSIHIGGEDLVFRAEAVALKERLGDANVYVYTRENDGVTKFQQALGLIFSLKSFIEVFALVRSKNIEIVHVHNFLPLISPSVFLAAKLAGAKLVLTLHNYRWWCIAGTFFEDTTGICEHCKSKIFSFRPMIKRCLRGSALENLTVSLAFACFRFTRIFDLADLVFVLTEFQRRKTIELGVPEERVRLKPNFVEIKQARPETIKEDKLLFVGRLETSKGISSLLESWSRDKLPYKLEIIGVGDLEAGLKERYSGCNVEFLGKKSHDETLLYVAKAKYLIQSSIWYETFGLTIIEAMALGTPVIGYSIGTRPEFIKDGFNGFLTEEKFIASTIHRAMKVPNYEELSRNAISFSRNFDKSLVVEDQISIYRELAFGT